MIYEPHLHTLSQICGRLIDPPFSWALTGSLGMAIQGMPVEVHDIDLQTSQEGAYQIEARLAEYVTQPVHYKASARIRSHFGALEIEGIKVEIMGGVQKLLEDGSWEEPAEVERYLRWINFEGLRVPVLELEYERQAYLKMGRGEKAEMIRVWLAGRGAGHLQRSV
jgi:hypothetical protein